MDPALRSSDVITWLAARSRLWVVCLHDPVVEAVGFGARSAYAEAYWLGVLGPSALLALRRVSMGLDRHPDGFSVELDQLARELGLGASTTRHAPVVKAIARLVAFGMAAVRGDALAVRRSVPPLARRHVARLPLHLAERHRAEIVGLSSPCPAATAPPGLILSEA